MAVGPDVGEVADRLACAVEEALPAWVERSVRRRLSDWGADAGPEVISEAAAAGHRASQEVGGQVRHLLATDVDEQWTNPLAILRGAVRFPGDVLRRAGVPPVVRDEFDERHFPDDDYDLVPRSFADIDPSLHDLGLAWGAAKAYTHLARREHRP